MIIEGDDVIFPKGHKKGRMVCNVSHNVFIFLLTSISTDTQGITFFLTVSPHPFYHRGVFGSVGDIPVVLMMLQSKIDFWYNSKFLLDFFWRLPFCACGFKKSPRYPLLFLRARCPRPCGISASIAGAGLIISIPIVNPLQRPCFALRKTELCILKSIA
jgi:hypothetical protein